LQLGMLKEAVLKAWVSGGSGDGIVTLSSDNANDLADDRAHAAAAATRHVSMAEARKVP
jgi:hypothetical protein